MEKIKNYPLDCGCVLWFYLDKEERFVERMPCEYHHD